MVRVLRGTGWRGAAAQCQSPQEGLFRLVEVRCGTA